MNIGPWWWWSNGQPARLLLDVPSLNPAKVCSLFSAKSFAKKKINGKEARDGPWKMTHEPERNDYSWGKDHCTAGLQFNTTGLDQK